MGAVLPQGAVLPRVTLFTCIKISPTFTVILRLVNVSTSATCVRVCAYVRQTCLLDARALRMRFTAVDDAHTTRHSTVDMVSCILREANVADLDARASRRLRTAAGRRQGRRRRWPSSARRRVWQTRGRTRSHLWPSRNLQGISHSMYDNGRIT